MEENGICPESSVNVITLSCALGIVLHQESFPQIALSFKYAENDTPGFTLFRSLVPGGQSRSGLSFHSLLAVLFPA